MINQQHGDSSFLLPFPQLNRSLKTKNKDTFQVIFAPKPFRIKKLVKI